jgi:vacuolar-type H+-ATPase subunit I/STV1
VLRRAGDSESSAESAQIIRELNGKKDSTKERDHYTRMMEKHRNVAKKENARRIAATASVEDVVLRALSVRDNKKVPRKQHNEETRNDPIARSRNRNNEAFTGVHSNPERSSLRVVTGAPDHKTSDKPVQSRKSLLHNFMRNRTRKGRGAETTDETAE